MTQIKPQTSSPRWAVYEAVVADLEGLYENCEVIRDHKVTGKYSRIPRQVDIWVSARVGGLNHEVTVAVECKCYETGKKVGIRDIDAFYGFLKDIGADKGVMVAASSFTSGAQARASGSEIETRILPLEDSLTFDWADFLLSNGCSSYYGCVGDVQWSCHEKPRESAYGYCNHCGSFHIRCGFCGYTDLYSESEGYLTCNNDDCSAVFRIDYDDGVIDRFVADLRRDET